MLQSDGTVKLNEQLEFAVSMGIEVQDIGLSSSHRNYQKLSEVATSFA